MQPEHGQLARRPVWGAHPPAAATPKHSTARARRARGDFVMSQSSAGARGSRDWRLSRLTDQTDGYERETIAAQSERTNTESTLTQVRRACGRPKNPDGRPKVFYGRRS